MFVLKPCKFLYFKSTKFSGSLSNLILHATIQVDQFCIFFFYSTGNSSGFMLIFIWLALLLLALFLPSDLAENSGNESSVIEKEDDHDLALPNSIPVDSDNSSSPLSETSDKVFVAVEEDSEDDISLSKSVAEPGSPPSSMVFCLYYLICLSLFVYMVISFYFPLLAKYHLGLGLTYVKLIYINSTLFVFILFFAASLFLENISESIFLFVTIFAQVIPISITFYFGLSWNNTMSVNESYLLFCSMLFLSTQFLNIPLASSLLSKITPVKSASFYQSLTYTAVHLGVFLSRLTAGATFGKMPMIYTCAVLAFCWLFGMLWLGYEYRKSARVINTDV